MALCLKMYCSCFFSMIMFAAWLIDDVSIKFFADNAKIYSVVENVNLHSEQLQKISKTNVSLIALADPFFCSRISVNK